MTFFRDPEKPSREVPDNLEGYLSKHPGIQIADENARHPADSIDEPESDSLHNVPAPLAIARLVRIIAERSITRESTCGHLRALDWYLNGNRQGETQCECAARWGYSKQAFAVYVEWISRVFGVFASGQRNGEHRQRMALAMSASHARRRREKNPAPSENAGIMKETETIRPEGSQ